LKSLDRPYTEIAKEALQHFLRAANYVSLQKIDDLRKIQTAIIMQI